MTLAFLQSAFNLLDHDSTHQLIWQINSHGIWIAQFEDNLGSSFQSAWDNFIQSGQVWALIIGFFVGYVFRSITSY